MPAAAPELQALAQDSPLVEALRAGDERAFLGLVGSLHPAMMRFARGVDPAEFLPPSHPRWAGHWAKWPEPWPEEQLLTREALAHVRDAIARLPEGQRAVIQLRDVEDWSSEEVCEALGLSDVNQRVLLHRARSRVRREIARHLERRRP